MNLCCFRPKKRVPEVIRQAFDATAEPISEPAISKPVVLQTPAGAPPFMTNWMPPPPPSTDPIELPSFASDWTPPDQSPSHHVPRFSRKQGHDYRHTHQSSYYEPPPSNYNHSERISRHGAMTMAALMPSLG